MNLAAEAHHITLDTGDPWFLDKELLFGTGVYNTTRKYSAFDRKALGFDVLLGKSLSEYWKTDVTYNFESVTIHNISSNASARIKRSGRQKNNKQYYACNCKGFEKQFS